MSVLTADTVKAKVIEILPISDSTIYDSQLNILVSGAISKLGNEGVWIDAKDKNGDYIFVDGTGDGESPYAGNDYCVCIGYQVMKDLDSYDLDMNYMTEQYITRVNTLRCNISMKQR